MDRLAGAVDGPNDVQSIETPAGANRGAFRGILPVGAGGSRPGRLPGMVRGSAALAAVLLLGTTVRGALGREQSIRLQRFKLFNNCMPINLVAEDLSDDAKAIGLTTVRLHMAVESRLRSARLYQEAFSVSYLYANITVVGRAFSIALEFNKELYDPRTDTGFPATTWKSRGGGMHGNDGRYVVSLLSEYVNRFLVDYLRVNEAACGSR